MYNFSNLLILAAIAIFVLFRLFASFGKLGDEDESTGHEGSNFKTVIPIETETAKEAEAIPDIKLEVLNKESKEYLNEIMTIDPNFNLGLFMKKATFAFEYILDLYSKQDVNALKELVAPEVLSGFEKRVGELKASGKMLKIMIISVTDTKIQDIKLSDKAVSIKVSFDSHQIEYQTDMNGAIVSGNSSNVIKKEDCWTFSRKLESNSPNWLLVAT